MASPKTIFVLLDGADWSLLQPLLDRGWLPTLRDLIARGTPATVMGLAPFSAPMLRASAVTGQRAWRHGVVTGEGGGTTAPQPLTATLWDMTTAAGQPAIVVGGSATAPTRPHCGVFVSESFFSPSASIAAVLPSRLAAELEPLRVTTQTLDPRVIRLLCPQLSADVAAQDPLAGRLAAAVAHLYSVHNVAVSLLDTEPWTLGIVHHSFLATIRRSFAPLDSPRVSLAVQQRYADVVTGACRLLDMLLGQLLACAGQEARVIVASLQGGPSLDPQVMVDYPLRHAGAGCLIVAGSELRRGTRLGTFNILDLAPTILHSLQLPCPRDRDGRVLDELFVAPVPAPALESAPDFIDITPTVALSDSLAYFHLGIDLFEASRFAAALPHLESAARLQPESPVFAFWLACCQARLGLDKEASTSTQVLRDREADPRWQILSRLALIAGQGQRHQLILDLVTFPVAPGTLPLVVVTAVANVLMEADRWDDAFALLQDHLLHHPTNEIWLGIARCYLHWDRFQDAEQAARHVLADNSGLALAQLCLSRALHGLGRREESAQALRDAHRLGPQSAELRAAITQLHPALARELPWRIARENIPGANPTCTDSAAQWRTPTLSPSPTANDTQPIYRPMRPDEAARVAALFGDPLLVAGIWRPHVWESLGAPRRFVGAVSWRIATGEPATAHLALALLPRFCTKSSAGELIRPLVAEIKTAHASQILITTHEAGVWEEVFRQLGYAVDHWTDEVWSGDPLLLRERLRRYDEVVPAWIEAGWHLRPLDSADWELVRQWGVAGDFLNSEDFHRLRPHHWPALSGIVVNRGGPAGLLVAAGHQRTATLELLVGAPHRPEGWGIVTALLLRRFVEYSSPLSSCDNFVLTANLHHKRAKHNLSRLPGLRRTREHHHFLVCL